MLLIDTGARIDEVLGAKLSNVDLEQLLVRFLGKGRKERLLPISVEMRKVLWVYINRHRFKVPSDYLFPTRHGAKLEYHNTLRGIKELCGRLGIEGVRLSLHGLRHFYAVDFLWCGGDL
jgi:integrase